MAGFAVALGLLGCGLCKVPALCRRCLVTKDELTFSVLSLRTAVQCDYRAFSLLLFFLSWKLNSCGLYITRFCKTNSCSLDRGHFCGPLLSGGDCRFEDHRRSGGPGPRASLSEDSVGIPFPFCFSHLSLNRSTWRAEAQANQSEYQGTCLCPHPTSSPALTLNLLEFLTKTKVN